MPLKLTLCPPGPLEMIAADDAGQPLAATHAYRIPRDVAVLLEHVDSLPADGPPGEFHLDSSRAFLIKE